MATLPGTAPSLYTHTPWWETPPRRLYSWAVHTSPGTLGATGVTDDVTRALDRLSTALNEAPGGARGEVHRATLNHSSKHDYGVLEATGRVDVPGAVHWWYRSRHAARTLPGAGQ